MSSSERAWQPVTPSAGMAPAAGAYSPAVRAGDFVYVSGQVPRDPRTGEMAGDVEAQTRQTLANVRAALAAAGATLDDVVSVLVHLADIEDWGKFNDVYKATFNPPYPTRTVVGAQLHGFLVEITVVAYVGKAG